VKHILILIVAASLMATAAFAEETYSPLIPKSAKSMAMGGVYSSLPTAEFSFLGNPANFADKKASFTVTSIDTWAYIKPTQDNIDMLANTIPHIEDEYANLFDLIPSNGGIGGGFSMSALSFAGKGLGVGFQMTSDDYAKGRDLPSSLLTIDTEASVVIGLGIPLQLGGLRLSIGGDLRPFYRIRTTDFPLAELVQVMAGTVDLDGDSVITDYDKDPLNAIDDINAGFGLALDVGATLEFGSLAMGLSIRDIAPPFPVWNGSLNDLITSVEESGDLPEQTEANTSKVSFVPNMTVGLSWAPKLIRGILEPAVYFELQDPISVAKNWDGAGSMLNLLHVGAEVKLLSMVSLRGGLNRGWLSAGAGFKLLFIDVNAAVFTEELGAVAGDKPRSGIALQAAIRF